MRCTEIIIDGRTKKPRVCNKLILGMTGLQELNRYKQHMLTRHSIHMDMTEALEKRAESGQ